MKKFEFSYQLIYRFMRIGLLPILLITTFAGTLYAKNSNGQEVLNRKVSLVAKQKEVKAILNELSKIADIKFVYSAQRIPCNQKVSYVPRMKTWAMYWTNCWYHWIFLPCIGRPDCADAQNQ